MMSIKEAFLIQWDGHVMGINSNEAFNDAIANAEHDLIEAVRNYSMAFAKNERQYDRRAIVERNEYGHSPLVSF